MKKNLRMFILLSIIAVLFTLLFTSCIMPKTRSVCDSITDPCRLCDMADKLNVRLETIRKGLVALNTGGIAGVYSREDAIMVITTLTRALDEPLTYIFFGDLIRKYAKRYPTLLNVGAVYIEEFAVNKLMCETDKDLLRKWLQRSADRLTTAHIVRRPF